MSLLAGVRVACAVARGAHVRVLAAASLAGDSVVAFLKPKDQKSQDRNEDQRGAGGAVGGVALVDGDVGGFGVEAVFGSVWGDGGDEEGDVFVGLVEVPDHAADEADFEEGVDGEEGEEGGEEEGVG